MQKETSQGHGRQKFAFCQVLCRSSELGMKTGWCVGGGCHQTEKYVFRGGKQQHIARPLQGVARLCAAHMLIYMLFSKRCHRPIPEAPPGTSHQPQAKAKAWLSVIFTRPLSALLANSLLTTACLFNRIGLAGNGDSSTGVMCSTPNELQLPTHNTCKGFLMLGNTLNTPHHYPWISCYNL